MTVASPYGSEGSGSRCKEPGPSSDGEWYPFMILPEGADLDGPAGVWIRVHRASSAGAIFDWLTRQTDGAQFDPGSHSHGWVRPPSPTPT